MSSGRALAPPPGYRPDRGVLGGVSLGLPASGPAFSGPEPFFGGESGVRGGGSGDFRVKCQKVLFKRACRGGLGQ